MRFFQRILAIAFAICGAEAALSQQSVQATLDYESQRLTVIPPEEFDGVDGEITYSYFCNQLNLSGEIESFSVWNRSFLQQGNSVRHLTFAQITQRWKERDEPNCNHINIRVRSTELNKTYEIENQIRIEGVRRQGDPPHVTVNIDHIGDGYTEGDVYSFNVVYTEILGVRQTVRNDEQERFSRVFGNVQWFKTGIRSKDNLIAFPSSSSTDNLFVNPPSPFPERRFIFLPVRDIECTGESCETELMPTLGDAIAYQPIESPPPPQYPHTYTLSHSHFFDSYHIRDNGEIIYLDHFAVRITDKWEHTEQPFSGLTQYGVSWGFIPRNEPTEVSEIELYRTFDPLSSLGTPVEEPVSFAEFAFGDDKDKLYNSPRFIGDRNNGIKIGTRFTWQHRINGGEWITTEDEFIPGIYFTNPGHFVGAKAGDEIQIRSVLDVEDGWGLRNYLFSPTLSHTDRPPTGDMKFIETGLHAEATVTTSLDEIEDPDGEIDVLSYRWQAGNGTVFTDILFQEYDEANRRLFADSIRNVPYILDASVFNQEGNSGMRVIAELTDSFFGQATITSGFFLVNPPTEGTVSINGNPLFSDGEIYTLTNVDELTDESGIGTFSYTWYVSIDGGNSYDRRGAFGTTFTLKASHIAEANADTPVLLRADVVHTDADRYTQTLVAFFEQNFPTQGEITIDGNPMFADGEIYTAITAGLSDSNEIGGFTYQWLVSFDDGNNYNEIAGETGETYTADTADFAAANPNTPIFLGVSAVHTDLDGYAQTITAFLEQDLPTQGDIVLNVIANPLVLGEVKFSVNVDALTDGNDIGDFAYQWFASIARDADYNPISAATDRSYILDRSDFAGAAANEPVRISVSVVHTDLAGYEQSFGDFFVQNPRTEGEITIDGNPMFADGEIYTAITAGLSDRNGIGDFTYQWVISFDGGNNYNTNGILGIDSTYTLRAEDIANADENIPALLGVAAVHTDLDGNTQTLTASFLQDIAGTGSVSISGANSFAAGEKYTAITNIADANVIGTVSYSWQASTDGGNNYNLITDANSESYTLALSDFSGATSANPVHLLLSVVHTDFGGFDQSYLATLIHSDTATGGSLGIGIRDGIIAEDAVVELDTAGISDINGGGIVSHSWHLDNGAAIAGADAATYTLQSANLTLSEIRNGVLHSEVLYRDSFGYETRFSITLFGEGDDEEYDPDNPNELDSMGTGTVAISGTISFAANERYTADISDIAPNDANGKGTFTYSWHTSTDGGTNYDLISGATLELYTLALSDFAGANANAEVHLRVSVVHTDFGGFDQSYLATLIHSDTAADGDLGIGIRDGIIAEDAVVELDTAGISDINGGGIISHSWHLDNGAAIVGETSATYILSSANLTLSEIRNGVLHSEVLYRDSFGYETRFSITLFGEGDDEEYDPNNPNELDSPGTGTVAISGTISFAANERYTADISDIAPNDANGEGDFAYSWHTSTDGGNNYTQITGATLELYTLALSDFAGANANAEVHLRVSVVHTDFGGFDQSYLATLIHSDTAAGGSLGIEIQNGVIAENAVVELDTAAISDINGGGIVSHSWYLDNGAAIAGETSATYILSSANLTLSEIRNGVLHSEVLYRDSFGYETRFSITLFGEGDDEEYDPNNPNELDSLGTGTVAISGTISFAANERYTADISDIAPNDANGEGDFAYSWHTSTDGGTNYTQITDANSESYTLALSDFAGANANAEVHLRVSVVHTDFGGFDQSYLATLIHSDTAAGGSLGIEIQSGVIAEGAIVELDTAGISDINGGGIVSHSWHLDNGAAIVGETSATYILSSANLTLSEIRNGILHSEVLYRDSFGYETRFSITLFGEGDDEEYDPNNPNELDSMGTGTVAISGTISFAAGEKYTADISDIAPNDANGEGDFAYSWHTSTDGGNNYTQITGATLELYTLALSDFAGANANAEVHLRVSVVHTDFGGFDQSYLATLIHSDTAAGGSLGIGIRDGIIAEDAVVELDTAGISDINGGGIISHSWHLDNGAAIVGETSATYTLQAANLTLSEIRNGVLHSEVLYRDSFGYETRFSITLFGEGDDEEYDPNNPNELDSIGTGTVAISGTISFAANERYTADISDIAPNDANGEGDFAYSWHTSTDGGTNYDLISGANSESYTLSLADFAGATSANPVHLLLSVVHTDFGGFDQSYLATLIHSDTAAGGSLGIEIQNGVIAEDAIVELDTAAISDINGGGIVSHSWHLDNGAAIAGATAATYILSSANLTLSEIRNGVLHSEVLYRDSFGYETRFSITLFGEGDDEEYDPNNPNELDSLGTGTVAISGTISFAANEKYTADISDIAPNDANGEGDFAYSWHTSTDGGTNYNLISGANSESYTLALSDFAGANANAEVHLRVSVVHTDFGGFDQSYLATLIHSDTAAGGSLGIVAAGLMAGDLVTADAAGLTDANGALTISYRWQTGERNTPESFADLVGETEAVYTIYADDYDSDSRDSLRLIARTADPFGGETEITSAILPINRETEGRISLELVGGEIVAGATIRLRTDAVSDENGGGFEKYYWFINDLLLMEENDDFLIVRSDDLRDIAAGGLRAEAKYVDGIGFTVRLSARLIAAGIVAPSPEEIANWSVVIETEGVAFGEDLARANLIGAEQSDYYEVFYRWRTGVGIAFADERNVGGVGNYHQLEAANFNPQDHLRAIAEVELLSGTFVTLTSAPVQIDYPSIGAVRIVAGELLAPGVVVSADISDVRDANGGVNVVSERWLYADTPVAMARSYTLTEEAVHAGKVFYEATFADAAGFRTSLRAEANVGGEVSSEKAEAIIGAVNAAAIDGLWNALEGHLDSEAGWRANGAPIEDPSQIAAALSRRDENSLHPDSPFALDSFALKESGGEAGEEWSWWAHGSRSRLKGKPIIDGEEVKYHGDYASFHAGMDRQISDTVRAGLAFGADDADLDVEWRKGVDGQLRQNIRSLIPYTEWRPDDLTNVRILAGYGEGDIYLAEHDNASRASARRTLFGIRAARRKDLADNFDITFSGGFDKTRLQTGAIDLPGLQDDLDARTKETHARVRGGHISLLPAKGSLHKEISLRWRSQSVAGDRDSVFDLGIGFNATLPEYFLSFGADGERQLTDSAHERNRFGVYIAYGAGRFAHILETRYDNEIALPQNRWQINTVSEWGVSELLTGVYVEHNGNKDLRIGWESNLLF